MNPARRVGNHGSRLRGGGIDFDHHVQEGKGGPASTPSLLLGHKSQGDVNSWEYNFRRISFEVEGSFEITPPQFRAWHWIPPSWLHMILEANETLDAEDFSKRLSYPVTEPVSSQPHDSTQLLIDRREGQLQAAERAKPEKLREPVVVGPPRPPDSQPGHDQAWKPIIEEEGIASLRASCKSVYRKVRLEVHLRKGRSWIGGSPDSTTSSPSVASTRGGVDGDGAEDREDDLCANAIADVSLLAPVPTRPALKKQILSLIRSHSRRACPLFPKAPYRSSEAMLYHSPWQ